MRKKSVMEGKENSGEKRKLQNRWLNGKTTNFNSVLQTGEGDGNCEVTEGCQQCCSVW